MSMQPHFETARETAVISKILADLVRTVRLIEWEIAAQEERASAFDYASPGAFPSGARREPATAPRHCTVRLRVAFCRRLSILRPE